jgi:predicted ABC-type ATPase
MPSLYIITGSNGAGKSSIGPNYLPENIQKKCIVFDGDKLFMDSNVIYGGVGSEQIKKPRNLHFLL